MARLILDSTVLIAAERGGVSLQDVIGDQDDAAIAALTVAELLYGVELAGSRHREKRLAHLGQVLTMLPIETYDLDVAREHAVLLGHTHRSGRQRSAHDLIIAATAVARRRQVVTHDVRGFDDLPGVALRLTSD